MRNRMVLLLGGMRIKIESDYDYPTPPHVMEFICNNNDEERRFTYTNIVRQKI